MSRGSSLSRISIDGHVTHLIVTYTTPEAQGHKEADPGMSRSPFHYRLREQLASQLRRMGRQGRQGAVAHLRRMPSETASAVVIGLSLRTVSGGLSGFGDHLLMAAVGDHQTGHVSIGWILDHQVGHVTIR